MNNNKKSYIKHLLECNCILPQFKNFDPPVFHKFVVFSIINEDGSIQPSFVSCPNCAAIHKIKEVNESVLIRRETMPSIPTIDDIKTTVPEHYSNILASYECELPTWQELKFILENSIWGAKILLSRDEVEETITGKFLLVLGNDLYKVDSFVY
jgi:hypothetical protein